MSVQEHDSIVAFDTLFTNNSIRKLKIFMPYLDAQGQKQLAVYIKYMELQYTISYFKFHQLPLFSCTKGGLDDIYQKMKPYCSAQEQRNMEQMQTMMSTMKQYQEMMEMASMMKDLFPEGSGGLSPDMLSGLFGTDTGSMFDLFAAMKNTESS